MTREIPLYYKGQIVAHTLVDDEDYDFLMQWRWNYYGRYVERGVTAAEQNAPAWDGTRIITMHRVVAGTQKGEHTDHINGNKLDNRKVNLRRCSLSENARNRKPQQGYTSQYKGVSWSKISQKWAVRIGVDHKSIPLGLFDSEIDAACVYNAAALKYHGEFASLNDIPGWENRKIERPRKMSGRKPGQKNTAPTKPRRKRDRSKFLELAGPLVR